MIEMAAILTVLILFGGVVGYSLHNLLYKSMRDADDRMFIPLKRKVNESIESQLLFKPTGFRSDLITKSIPGSVVRWTIHPLMGTPRDKDGSAHFFETKEGEDAPLYVLRLLFGQYDASDVDILVAVVGGKVKVLCHFNQVEKVIYD